MCCLPLKDRNANLNFVTLQITGPGYFARGCQGDNRYRIIEVESVVQKMVKVDTIADTMVAECESSNPVNAVGIPSRRMPR
jgi:hypothetical protein